jgi:ABC-type transporter Mla maintaining outer membrane lipid asymmetry ATPase subunit MlaF
VKLIADVVCLLNKRRIVEMGPLDQLGQSANPFVRQFFERRPEEERDRRQDYLGLAPSET